MRWLAPLLLLTLGQQDGRRTVPMESADPLPGPPEDFARALTFEFEIYGEVADTGDLLTVTRSEVELESDTIPIAKLFNLRAGPEFWHTTKVSQVASDLDEVAPVIGFLRISGRYTADPGALERLFAAGDKRRRRAEVLQRATSGQGRELLQRAINGEMALLMGQEPE